MSLADAFSKVQVRYAEQVAAETWGHLAPKKNIVYRGEIVFAVGCFGSDSLNPTILSCNLKSRKHGNLDSSPWFYESVNRFVCDHAGDDKIGQVFRFKGFFKNYVYEGKITEMKLV